ncbi:MAG: FHA domain-containing protein [Deltaproteobacteria bacterium]|nr:FHA domain-containing protein [Deltaproteobacteria bacterium]
MSSSQNQNKKTLRHFQCRDFLWEIFEQMSAELECSIDYLINEAMRQYARSRNYGPRTSAGVSTSSQQPVGSGGVPPRPPVPAPPPPHGGGARPGPPPLGGRPATSAPPPLPPRPAGGGAAPLPPRPGPAAGPVPGATLYLIFNGQKIPVTKEQFIIGRGSKSSDLPIKDGNISRKHAAVILHQGAYYLKDLGSTNGIEFNGRRIEQKRVEEGDIFHICDYELRFTYR